jgi:hypothetical protein
MVALNVADAVMSMQVIRLSILRSPKLRKKSTKACASKPVVNTLVPLVVRWVMPSLLVANFIP